jgi:hypothetical protein
VLVSSDDVETHPRYEVADLDMQDNYPGDRPGSTSGQSDPEFFSCLIDGITSLLYMLCVFFEKTSLDNAVRLLS